MNILKSIGGFLLAIAGIVGITLVAFLLITGGAWLADKAYPWLILLFTLALGISIFILLPLAIFRRTRGFAGLGIYIASYIFGITLWVWCLLTVYTLWGGFAVVIGILMGGVGVVPLAIIAAAIKGLWSLAIQMIVVALVTFGARFLGLAFVQSAEAYQEV